MTWHDLFQSFWWLSFSETVVARFHFPFSFFIFFFVLHTCAHVDMTCSRCTCFATVCADKGAMPVARNPQRPWYESRIRRTWRITNFSFVKLNRTGVPSQCNRNCHVIALDGRESPTFSKRFWDFAEIQWVNCNLKWSMSEC